MENLQFIMDFYQNSWDNLLWVIGFAGAALGLIWPTLMLFLNHQRNVNYQKELDNMLDKKENEIDTIINNKIKQLEEKSKTIDDKILKLKNNQDRINGNMLFSQAQSTADPFLKLLGLLYAYLSFISVEDMNCMNIVYFNISPYFQNDQNFKKYQ
jgi:hypothetical protein